MSEHFSFYIKKDGKYVPFKSFINTHKDNFNYYYLSNQSVRASFLNRWIVLNRCGKKFIANGGSLDEVETTPNDVVAFPHTMNWKAMGMIELIGLPLSIIYWLSGFLIHYDPPLSFMDCLYLTFWWWGIFGIFILIGYFKSIGYKSEAKEWNELKIPEEKLIIVPVKSIEQIAEEYAESQVVSGKNIPEWDDEVKNIISRHFMAGYNQSKSLKDNQTNL